MVLTVTKDLNIYLNHYSYGDSCMLKLKHLLVILILFVICMVAIFSFTHYNEEVDKQDYTTNYEEKINESESYNVSIANSSYDSLENSLSYLKIENLVFS